MRHLVAHKKLNRTGEHRRALHRNLAQSLIQHGQVRTTLPKAKDIRPFVEKLVTLAKKARGGDLNARRRIHKLLADRSFIDAEHQKAYDNMSDAHRRQTLRSRSGRRYRTGDAKGRLDFTGETVTHRLINTWAEKFADRQGGYTRIIRLAKTRIGDNAPLAIVQFVGEEEGPGNITKPRKSARRKRADARYKATIKAAKSWQSRPAPAAKQEPATTESSDEETKPTAENNEPSES